MERPINIGFAITGSFCTFAEVLPQVEALTVQGYHIYPILSPTSYRSDTRFGSAVVLRERLELLTGNPIISTIPEAEPIGPKKLLDLMVVAPCTGNTLGKLAGGITDTSVTMAVKAHLRNERPVLLGVSTNDALAGSAVNIGKLLNTKHIFFIPMQQDDAKNKPRSMVADFAQIPQAVAAALAGEQLQPLICG